MIEWSPQRIAALSTEDLKNLRANALRKAGKSIIELCDAEIERRTPARAKVTNVLRSGLSRTDQYVGGYHFVCPAEKGVIRNGDGTFWTGTWVVEKLNAEMSTKHGAYIALHVTKSDQSYLQGNLKDWRQAERDREYAEGQLVKIPMGVDFLVEPTDQPYQWIGDGAGEKGYAWKDVPK